MMEKKTAHSRWLHIRLKEPEYDQIRAHFETSAYRKLSEYARKVLLKKPVKINCRNQSLDELMNELILLRQELNAIGNNYNQAVKRLHVLSENYEVRSWISMSEHLHGALLREITEIKLKMDKINDEWLRS